VDYVRLERKEVIIELYDGMRIIYQAVRTESLKRNKEVEIENNTK
jgi:hypothetical protein